MIFRVSDDKKFLVLVDSTQLEYEQLEYSLTRKVDNWFIIQKKIKSDWNGETKFMDSFNRVPIGLYQVIRKLCNLYNFQLEIQNGKGIFINPDFKEEDFDKWVKEFFTDEEFQPRDYQIEAAKKIIKYRFCTEEISTSGGKTLITYMVFRYLFDRGIIKKMLYVVPNINLVTQSEEKFYEYDERCDKKPLWKSKCVYSGAGKKDNIEDANIIFGTFQSLSKKDLSYFQLIDTVCVDETHHAKSSSIKTIILKCHNAKYKFGVTGTLPKPDSCDSYMLQAYLGPMVFELKSYDLINKGNATPIHVTAIELDYLDNELKKKLFDLRNVKADEKDGVQLLNLEKDTCRDNRKRLLYICNIIAKTTKNSLVLFSDIKNSYGRNIYDWLRENTDKNVYYIDGETNVNNRDFYKKKMEDEENVIIVASVGTFSEGIDITNLHSIFITESSKSEIIVAQILGRGMRLKDDKAVVNIIDFCDNYEYGSGYQRKNYLMRHAEERKYIYLKRKFPYKKIKVKI